MEKHIFFDENDNEVEFVIEAKFSIDDTDYVAMVPSDDLEAPIYILKVEKDDSGDEYLTGIDDEELKEATEVYEELMEEKLQ